jgi:hypothetical protein
MLQFHHIFKLEYKITGRLQFNWFPFKIESDKESAKQIKHNGPH